MLRTVLLLDGSDAMNRSSDYLPSYLLALRSPILSFASQYLNASPLAALGVVVMRDGVAHRLLPPTTSMSDICNTLETSYFLFGGSGATSLENGLRMALAELVDLKRVVAAQDSSSSSSSSSSATTTTHAEEDACVQRRILLISASVTLIDPNDVFAVMRTLRAFRVEVSVVSLVGAVHVFHECARITGGVLASPMSFEHLLHIMAEMAEQTAQSAADARARKSLKQQQQQPSIAIAFPILLGRSASSPHDEVAVATSCGEAHATMLTKRKQANSEEEDQQQQQHEDDDDAMTFHLACPQCHLLQSSVPSTCPLCGVVLCSVPLLYGGFARHNRHLLPPTQTTQVMEEEEDDDDDAKLCRCSLCSITLRAPMTVTVCGKCSAPRCGGCSELVRDTFGLCPTCIALR